MASEYFFQCIDCQTRYPGGQVQYLCPKCADSNLSGLPPKGVLQTIYDYPAISLKGSGNSLFKVLESDSFLDLLPIQSMNSWPTLKIGNTPLYRFSRFENMEQTDFPPIECYLKDDSQNPTFSFKDRASALVSAWAGEHGIDRIVAASTGNAGSSLAGICASRGQKSVIVVPATAPIAKLTQVLMYGATLIPVLGTYDDAFDLSIRLSETYGWYNRNTAFNPLTIEGKKSVSFELYAGLGYKVPDRIFVPTGDGVILSGVYKGFEDLLQLGIIERMPVVVAVQAEGSPNVVNNLSEDTFVSQPSKTIADSISVDIPRNFYMSRYYIRRYCGESVCVSDDEIRKASVMLARNAGIFSEPAAVAAFAGMLKYRGEGKIPERTSNVVLLTGSGLKDPGAARSLLTMPEVVEATIEAVKDIFDR